jgi:hypothetical protein
MVPPVPPAALPPVPPLALPPLALEPPEPEPEPPLVCRTNDPWKSQDVPACEHVPLTTEPATCPVHRAPSGVVKVKSLPDGKSRSSEPSLQLAVHVFAFTTQEEGELHVPVTP